MIQGLILAAGNAQRYGEHKLLVKLPNGVPMAQQVVRRFSEAVDNIAAVVRSDDTLLIELFREENVTIIPCAQSASGMGYSIACGVSETRSADGWLIALADMPFIKPATIQAVADALKQGAKITVPTYEEKLGHPVGFAAALRKELLALQGDKGARILLHQGEQNLVRISCDDPAIQFDIDTPEDFTKYT